MSTDKLPPLNVQQSEAESLLQEIKIIAETRRRTMTRDFDPELGDTADDADEALLSMRGDIGRFGEYVFGLSPAPVHQLWNRVADDVIERRVRQNKVLFIAPPNTAKSTWNSIIRPTHYLGNHPDHNVIFFTSSDPMADTFRSPVQAVLASNERYRTVFPDPVCRPNKARGWSSAGLYLRGTPAATKDPAYKAVGYNATIMGARAHGLIIDDPMDQKTAVSETEQRRAKAYYDQTLVPRLQPNSGWIIAVMTRFHENDLASHFIRLAQESGDWIVITTPMIAIDEHDPLGREPGELLWPERFDAEFVQREQARMGTAEFNLVHQGDPTGIGGDVFKEETWFQPLPSDFWSRIFPKTKTIQAWDLAFSENKRACFTTGITAAFDEKYNLYILNVMRKRMTIVETEDTMVKLIRLVKPLIVGIEESRFHQQLTRALARRVLDRVWCNIQLINPDSDKTSRAMLPAARAEAGKIFIHKDNDWYRPFMSEILGFPNTRYKDQVDSLSLLGLLVERLSESKNAGRIIQTEVVMA